MSEVRPEYCKIINCPLFDGHTCIIDNGNRDLRRGVGGRARYRKWLERQNRAAIETPDLIIQSCEKSRQSPVVVRV